MKTLKKIILVLLCIFVVFCVAAVFAAKSMLSQEKIRVYAEDAAKKYLGRQIKYDKLSFNIIGVSFTNLSVSENPSFESGTFVKAGTLSVKVKLFPLLRKEIRVKRIIIDGLDVKIIRNKDGIFNFDDIIKRFSSSNSNDEPAAAKPVSVAPQALFLEKINFKNSDISYEDISSDMSAAIKNLNAEIEGFNFSKAFLCETDFNAEYRQAQTSLDFPVKAVITANLKDMDFVTANFNLTSFSMKIEGMPITGKVSVTGFNSPKIDFTVSAETVTNDTFKRFVKDLPEFSIDKIDAAAKLQLNIDKKSADIESLSLSMQGISAAASGSIGWGKDLNYNLKVTLDFMLETISKIIPGIVKPYDPKGRINASANVTPSLITVDAKASSVSFKFDPMFAAENIDASIEVNSVDNIKLGSISGVLNGKKFGGSASYLKTKSALNVGLNLDMDGLIINGFPQTASPDSNIKTEQPSSQNSLPLNLNADLKTGNIKMPYFH